jgi:predicted nucleic acid-binding protein
MNVVSNASPLINLARIGKLDLLRQLYGEIVIPQAVWNEVVMEGAGQPGAEEVSTAGWIKQQTVANSHLVHALRQELDAGESEAIVLALETKAKLLLMDERLGRETAQHLGVRCIGLVGILVQAKRIGFVSAIRPYLDALRNTAGFRVGNPLYTRVLHDAGEL